MPCFLGGSQVGVEVAGGSGLGYLHKNGGGRLFDLSLSKLMIKAARYTPLLFDFGNGLNALFFMGVAKSVLR